MSNGWTKIESEYNSKCLASKFEPDIATKNIDLESRTMAEFLDRILYRKIKGMNREALESLIQEFYNMGKESVDPM